MELRNFLLFAGDRFVLILTLQNKKIRILQIREISIFSIILQINFHFKKDQ